MNSSCQQTDRPTGPQPPVPTQDLKFSGVFTAANAAQLLQDSGTVATIGTVVSSASLSYAFDGPRKIYGFTVNVPTPLIDTNETLDFQLTDSPDGLGTTGVPILGFSIAYAQTGTPPSSGVVTFTADTPFTLPEGHTLGVLATRANGSGSSRTFAVTVKAGLGRA